MALEQKLHLKLAQKLVMTPTLQQAIKLLQISRLELEQTLAQEVQGNPLLEMAEESYAEGEAQGVEEPAAADEADDTVEAMAGETETALAATSASEPASAEATTE